jgi:hypothetical protein
MSETAWRDVTQDCLRDEGGERWLRAIDDECFITVLHRMTGFGYMEWETFIVFRTDTLLIRGDWRDELAEMPKERLRSWYDENIGAEMRHALGVARHEIARLTAERDAALRKREEEKQKFREYEHWVMTGRSEQHDRLVTERDTANKEVNRLRLTDEEREVLGRVADDACYRAMDHTEHVVRKLLERSTVADGGK